MSKKIVFKTFVTIIIIIFTVFLFKNFHTLSLVITSLANVFKVSVYTEDLIAHNTHRGNATYDTVSYTWDSERQQHSWKYYNGLMMKAFLLNDFHKSYVDKFYDDNITEDGFVNSRRNRNNYYREGTLDDVAPARTLFYLSDSPNAEKYKLNLKYVYYNLALQPTLTNVGNNYVHKTNNNSWSKYPFGLDGLYMALPFPLEYEKYILKESNQETFDEVFRRMRWVAQNLRNSDGLYYHGVEKDGKTKNGYVWLRAVGWYAMAQVDIINLFPEGEKKDILIADLTSFFDAMLKYQDPENGMWRNVIYKNSENLACNYFESSGSAMMAYTLMYAYLNGYVKDKKYAYAGLKAFNGIVNKNLVRYGIEHYKLIYTYKSAIVNNSPERYCICDNYVADEAKGVAPLIMASGLVRKTLFKILINSY